MVVEDEETGDTSKTVETLDLVSVESGIWG
jgi:hypothetical protein